MKIVIPTLGRVNNQVTYNSLPDKWKKEVTFVVQAHEYEQMKSIYGDQVLSLPEEIKTLAPTRTWIQQHFFKDRYWVFDDDLKFFIKDYVNDGKRKWASVDMTEKDFDEMIQHAHDFMDKGYAHGGCASNWIMPCPPKPGGGPGGGDDLYPFRSNFRQCTNCFFDGPNLPVIEWDRCPATEDMDGTLQLIMNFMKCPNRADQMCVFEVDGVFNLVVSSKTLDQNLSTEGSKVFFFEFNGLFCCSNKEGFFLTNFRLF